MKDTNTGKSPSKTPPEKAPVDKPADASNPVAKILADRAPAARIADTLANMKQLVKESNDGAPTAPINPFEWSQALERSHKKLADQLTDVRESFEKQLDDLKGSILERLSSGAVAATPTNTAIASGSDSGAKVSDEPESDWERRKREMYAEFGETLPKDMKAEKSRKNEDEESQDGLASLQESLHDSIESLDGVQAEEIEDLRAQLTEKLREAEVELSINRAKLDQRTAELERRQTELDRREKSLASKYDVDGKPQKAGVLDRLTRHLGVRKQVDSL